jgi:regulator of protease activity HflC (stomatin/prohibitin superfamily)
VNVRPGRFLLLGITEIRNTDTCQASAYDAPGLHFLIPFSVICQRVKALDRSLRYQELMDFRVFLSRIFWSPTST